MRNTTMTTANTNFPQVKDVQWENQRQARSNPSLHSQKNIFSIDVIATH